MSRHHTEYLLPIVLMGLLLAIVSCIAPPEQTTPVSPTPSATVTSTGAPAIATPVTLMPQAWGVAVLENAVVHADLRLMEMTEKPLAYNDFESFSGEKPDGTPGQVVLALAGSIDKKGSPVLYSSLPITGAVAWYEYSWFAPANSLVGPEIVLGPVLPISSTIQSQVGDGERTLGDSYRRLNEARWDSKQARRLLLRDAEGHYQLVLLECLPGERCPPGEPVPGDRFCSWCDSCNSGWCSSCKLFC